MRSTSILLSAAALAFVASGCVVGSTNEPAVTLGAQALPGYHIQRNAAIPAADISFGFGVTANGQGGYRIVFSDASGASTLFAATITADTAFDPQQTIPITGQETLSMSGTTVNVSGRPGSTFMGVDVVPSSDPIYLDATANGSRTTTQIVFIGAHSGLAQDSSYDPVAFTSP
jgi:hypothetical protein